MTKEKELKDWTFEELVEHNTRQIHLGLLDGGSKGMKMAVHMASELTLRWHNEVQWYGQKYTKKV